MGLKYEVGPYEKARTYMMPFMLIVNLVTMVCNILVVLHLLGCI